MIRNRSLPILLLGVWLGASILVDLAVTQNFQTVDRFLAAPGNPATTGQLDAIGRSQERVILRKNAAEENNWTFLNWERAELVIGVALLAILMREARSERFPLMAAVALLVMIAGEHFLLTPQITSLGRVVDDLTSSDPQYRTFWMLHGFYSGLEILKMLIIFGLAARLTFARNTVSVASQETLIHG